MSSVDAAAYRFISRFISRHLEKVPSIVFRLFKYVIAARVAYHDVFQAMLAKGPDLELEKSNQSHKYVIDAFKQAFDVLGGIAWQESQAKAEDDHEVNDIDSIFTNKFATFKIDEEGGEADGDGDLGSEVEAEVSSQTRNRSRKKKSKKGARGRRSRTKGKKVIPEEPSSEDIPFESYRVIDAGDEDIMTDYLIGAYALVKEWTDLRAYIQGLWQEVAYEGLNSVIAAALTNMVKVNSTSGATQYTNNFRTGNRNGEENGCLDCYRLSRPARHLQNRGEYSHTRRP